MKRSRNNHNAIVHKKLSEILIRESKDPRFRKVTVSRVDAAKDFSFAKVYVVVFPTENVDSLIESLNHAAGFFSTRLGKTLKTRNTPKLTFVYDPGFDYSMKIESLMKKESPKTTDN